MRRLVPSSAPQDGASLSSKEDPTLPPEGPLLLPCGYLPRKEVSPLSAEEVSPLLLVDSCSAVFFMRNTLERTIVVILHSKEKSHKMHDYASFVAIDMKVFLMDVVGDTTVQKVRVCCIYRLSMLLLQSDSW
ncbi:unnamed protein product [Gongylonema pulchrum]|uniref:Uncharacterized protein n=1 Tax=Gongylonema pulchrum TaxID=637853 RepID=A0A183DSI1_9BILA|nr:unnamed protein product [Gongylonema pulchrum]